jgi:hypothetical protein
LLGTTLVKRRLLWLRVIVDLDGFRHLGRSNLPHRRHAGWPLQPRR